MNNLSYQRQNNPPDLKLKWAGGGLIFSRLLLKGDALASQGECVIDMTEIWNWRARNSLGGLAASPDLEMITRNGRQVFLAPDSDYSMNPSVAQAVKRLAVFLKRKKANVSLVLLPTEKDDAKTGVDDFLAGGHSIAELKALAVPA